MLPAPASCGRLRPSRVVAQDLRDRGQQAPRLDRLLLAGSPSIIERQIRPTYTGRLRPTTPDLVEQTLWTWTTWGLAGFDEWRTPETCGSESQETSPRGSPRTSTC